MWYYLLKLYKSWMKHLSYLHLWIVLGNFMNLKKKKTDNRLSHMRNLRI